MGKYFYYKFTLPYCVNKNDKISIKTEFGIYFIKFLKYMNKGEEIKFKIFVENENNNSVNNNYLDNSNYHDDENINPFNFYISNNNYLNRFYQQTGD